MGMGRGLLGCGMRVWYDRERGGSGYTLISSSDCSGGAGKDVSGMIAKWRG